MEYSDLVLVVQRDLQVEIHLRKGADQRSGDGQAKLSEIHSNADFVLTIRIECVEGDLGVESKELIS